ncbi:hypothetical protein CEXT_637501 [Caerostris extrusa]|uniref:Uncharacterized protein n=1 Tax=Caerostris extrusa TaxID=172846 RepID=A0AAV4QTC0_CAEEX|nr:hypothetical protein CEXT_637501 [Caerostris extrusa]
MCTDYLMRFTVTKALPVAEITKVAKYIVEETVTRGLPDAISRSNTRLLPAFIVVYLILSCKNFSLHLLKLEQNGAKQQVKKSKASCESSTS